MKKVSIIFVALIMSFQSIYADNSTYVVENGTSRKNLLWSELMSFNGQLPETIRQEKYDKMAVSPFIFYRGTAHQYYSDLDSQNLIAQSVFNSANAISWIQGDLHVQNYGAFDDDKGDIVFDLNDFDEAWVTSYLYDVFRAATSIVLVGRENNVFSDNEIDDFVDAFSESYLDQLDDYCGNNDEKNAKITRSNAYGKLDEFLDDTENDNSRKKMLNKWTHVGSNGRYFDLAYEKLEAVSSNERTAIIASIDLYKDNISSKLKGDDDYFKVLDVARRVKAGTGSLGTPRYYVLIDGDSKDDDDDRILDVKQQGFPAIFPYMSQDEIAPLSVLSPGERVIIAQKAMLTDVDDHLGALVLFDQSYSVRERSPFKESFDTTILTSQTRFTKLAEQWGAILATAHARADNDYNNDFVESSFENIVHQLTDHKHDEFRNHVLSFANNYANQVQIDYQYFLELLNANSL